MSHSSCTRLFALSMTFFCLGALAANAQAQPAIPGDAVALEKAITDYDAARIAFNQARANALQEMVEEPWESSDEFAARKADMEANGPESERKIAEEKRSMLVGRTWIASFSSDFLGLGSFDKTSKIWTINVRSNLRLLPWSGNFFLNLFSTANLAASWKAVDAAYKDKSLRFTLSLDVKERSPGVFLISPSRPRLFSSDRELEGSINIDLDSYLFAPSGTNKEVRPYKREVAVSPKTGIRMIPVNGGAFIMGGIKSAPRHEASVGNFYVSSTEVTQEQWMAVMPSNPSNFKSNKGALARPVESVSWFEAVDFCNKLSVMEGKRPAYVVRGKSVTLDRAASGYRLPTEAEWEFAARGGIKSKGFAYAGGSDPGDVAWYQANSGVSTHLVAAKMPNELDLFDMTGNVWEWCQDDSGADRVIRGGSWSSTVNELDPGTRESENPGQKLNILGFRLVLPDEE